MKKIIIFISLIILFLLGSHYKEEYYIIPNESIRLRIIANSNSVYDQFIKNEVKTNLEKELQNTMNQSTSIINARKIIEKNLEKYKENISNTLKENQYDKNFTINYGKNYFPEKEYKGVIYEEGEYESLLITIGEGQGNNWWCVLYPPICSLEVEESNEIEYKFFIKEIFEKYLK